MRQQSPTAIPLDLQLANELVRLRTLVADDALVVHSACQDPEIARFTSIPEPADVHQTRAWIESQQGRRFRGDAIDFGIVPVGGVAVVGAIGLSKIDLFDRRAEVRYWIALRSRRRGFAAAAVELLSAWAFGPPLELVRLGVSTDVDDTAARQTALRAGYEFEGVLRSYMYAKDRRWDLARYSLIAPGAGPSDRRPSAGAREADPDPGGGALPRDADAAAPAVGSVDAPSAT